MPPEPRVAGLPPVDRAVVMGILNVTPDSFSDGGRWESPDAAIAHGRHLLAEGADIVDVGGESTRPGAARPDLAAELDRVLPVVDALAGAGAVVSIDTMRAEVAHAAVAAGASVVNDVSGGLADPAMLSTVADLGTPYVVMHWRSHSDRMQDHASYDDVVEDVRAELAARAEAALAAGVAEDRLILDPGLGFAKNADHNWALLAHLDRLLDLGLPVLVGASRKAFLGALAGRDGAPAPTDEREAATTATTALAAAGGVWGVRVHEVRPNLDAALVAARWRREATR